MTKHSDGIWIIDAEANTVFANIAMAEILGTTVANLLGKPSFNYVFPEDLAAAQQLFDNKKHGDKTPFRFKLRREDGSSIWVNVLGTPMLSPAGELLGIVGTFSVSE